MSIMHLKCIISRDILKQIKIQHVHVIEAINMFVFNTTTLSAESNANNPAMSLIEQYSDILLNMMQSKMVSQFANSPQSLPPATREPGGES